MNEVERKLLRRVKRNVSMANLLATDAVQEFQDCIANGEEADALALREQLSRARDSIVLAIEYCNGVLAMDTDVFLAPDEE